MTDQSTAVAETAIGSDEDRATGLPQRTQSSSVSNPAIMLQTALEKGVDAETLSKFMDLHERWEEGQARKAFMEAIAEFKSNPPVVVKDMINKQYGSSYTSIGNLVNTVNEGLGRNKLHAHWEIEQGEEISVSCILTHALGHSDRVTMKAPPDGSGSKNPIQQIKSTITYLKVATFEAVTGIASVDGNADDDGNAAGNKEPDVTDWLAKIDESATPEELKANYTEAYNENKSHPGNLKRINATKDAKKKELCK